MKFDLTEYLRECIISECGEKDNPTLVDVISRFDMHQHAIPTLEEFTKALRGTNSIAVSRNGNEIIISSGDSKDNIEITESDLSEAYKQYIKKVKSINI